MERTPHILVVDDHREIRELLARYLGKQNLRVSVAANGREMQRQLKAGAIDLIILDLMMPGENGLSLCQQVRAGSALPIIMLTAMGEEADRVIGLELGADDYVTKPFSPRELLARIRAVLRRVPAESAPAPGAGDGRQRLRIGSWIFDPERRELEGADGVAVALSGSEFRLLRALCQRPGMVLSRDQLLDITAGRSADAFDRSIDNSVSRLRKKLGDDPKAPVIIKTVWGEGYALAVPVAHEGAP